MVLSATVWKGSDLRQEEVFFSSAYACIFSLHLESVLNTCVDSLSLHMQNHRLLKQLMECDCVILWDGDNFLGNEDDLQLPANSHVVMYLGGKKKGYKPK